MHCATARFSAKVNGQARATEYCSQKLRALRLPALSSTYGISKVNHVKTYEQFLCVKKALGYQYTCSSKLEILVAAIQASLADFYPFPSY